MRSVFLFKQKTAYEMRISDWSSDVCSSDLFALLVFTNYLREEGRREQVRSAFRYYLSPALVDQLANEPGRLVLGGECREMTILFSDVRGFTEIAERLQKRSEEPRVRKECGRTYRSRGSHST